MTVYTLSGMRWNPQARRELSYFIRTRNPTQEQVQRIIVLAEKAAEVSFSLVTQSIIYSVCAEVMGDSDNGAIQTR